MKKKRNNFKIKLTESEKLLSKLEEATRIKDHPKRIEARSLINYYLNYHSFTEKQIRFAKLIIGLTPENKKLKNRFIYGIRIGNYLKVGMSINVRKRIKHYETASPDNQLIGYYPLGEIYSYQAKNEEKKIFKKLRSHKVKGELFNLEAIPDFIEILGEHLKSYIDDKGRTEFIDYEYFQHMQSIKQE
jgi:hypothetical protein